MKEVKVNKNRVIFYAVVVFLLAQAFVLAFDTAPLGYFDGNLGYFDGN